MKPVVRKLKHDILKCPKIDFHEEKQKTRMCKRYLNIRKIYGRVISSKHIITEICFMYNILTYNQGEIVIIPRK